MLIYILIVVTVAIFAQVQGLKMTEKTHSVPWFSLVRAVVVYGGNEARDMNTLYGAWSSTMKKRTLPEEIGSNINSMLSSVAPKVISSNVEVNTLPEVLAMAFGIKNICPPDNYRSSGTRTIENHGMCLVCESGFYPFSAFDECVVIIKNLWEYCASNGISHLKVLIIQAYCRR